MTNDRYLLAIAKSDNEVLPVLGELRLCCSDVRKDQLVVDGTIPIAGCIIDGVGAIVKGIKVCVDACTANNRIFANAAILRVAPGASA